MTPHSPRRGFTLWELLVVMAILLILAVIILPSIGAFRGSTRPQAAADVIQAELATARARAKEEGRPYRVAISEDGTRIRRGPDETNFAEMSAFEHSSSTAIAIDYAFEHVKAQVVTEQDGAPAVSNAGWVTVATVMPDGTCREGNILVSITEEKASTIYLRIRGVTASARVIQNPINNGGTR